MSFRFCHDERIHRMVTRGVRRFGYLAVCGVVIAALLLSPRFGSAQQVATSSSTADAGAGFDIQKLRDVQRKTQQAIEKVAPCIVSVSGGSGVVVSEDGIVLTVAHVGQRAGRTVTMTFPDGRRVRGKTLGNDEGADAGMIKITEQGTWPHVEMGSTDDLQVGQWCLAMGYPVTFDSGKTPAVRLGRIQRISSTSIVTDCTIMGGDSGGALLDLDGKLIGIGSRCDNRLAINIHVPIDCYNVHWERLTTGDDFDSRKIEVAFLGVVPDEEAEDAKIGHVYEDSAAAKAGIAVGDVIVRFDGTPVDGAESLASVIKKKKPGDAVKVEVRRGEQRIELDVTLGKRDG